MVRIRVRVTIRVNVTVTLWEVHLLGIMLVRSLLLGMMSFRLELDS